MLQNQGQESLPKMNKIYFIYVKYMKYNNCEIYDKIYSELTSISVDR